ncbi:FadR/GntR family transcriptional regulator [Pigmentiphaga sp. YJ18]|uniref:FadR/GntR family transcriptional regulator n=1 Tax=Pigmentiphaga sp. YJ18 TaxID=3134907 RepID=UPI00310E8907
MRSIGRTRSLSEELVQLMSEKIHGKVWKPGDKLPTEAEIMQEYGVSRTVVREAISRLQAARMVETRHGIGTFLLEPPVAPLRLDTKDAVTMLDVMAVLELRITVETEAARLAAQRRTEQDLAELRRTLAAFEAQIEPGGDTVTADLAFHQQVAIATGNRYFHEILAQMGATIIPRTRVDTAELARDDRRAYLARVHREHQAIYEAIARQDGDAAHAAMRTHLARSREKVRQAYAAGQGDAAAATI